MSPTNWCRSGNAMPKSEQERQAGEQWTKAIRARRKEASHD